MCMYVAKMNVTKVFIVYYKLLNIRPYYVIKFQIPYKDDTFISRFTTLTNTEL